MSEFLQTQRKAVFAVVFLLCGLWHGASPMFVLWGLWNALFLVIERAFWSDALRRMSPFAGWVYTMAVLMPGFVLFRSVDMHQGWTILSAMAGVAGAGSTVQPMDSLHWIVLCIAPIFALPTGRWIASAVRGWVPDLADYLARSLTWPRIVALALIMVYSLSQLAQQTYNPFIYFRF